MSKAAEASFVEETYQQCQRYTNMLLTEPISPSSRGSNSPPSYADYTNNNYVTSEVLTTISYSSYQPDSIVVSRFLVYLIYRNFF